MKFQILNKEDKAISINELDKEAAEFWGQEVDPEHYASPYKKVEFTNPNNLEPCSEQYIRAKILHDCKETERTISTNWYDIIGFRIACPLSNWTSGWNNVIHSLCSESIGQAVLTKDFIIPDEFEWNDEYLSLPQDIQLAIFNVLSFMKPYVDLIKYWESKGYKPVKV